MKESQQQWPSLSSSSFPSPSSLSEFLTSHGISSEALSSWGRAPGSKTLQNLWIEISNGDSSISLIQHNDSSSSSSSRPLRAVNVAILNIKNGRGATLIEAQQLLSDGTVRDRNRRLSEKMKPGESIEDAAARGVREELGVSCEVLMETYRVSVDEETDSVSYPGLPARYVLHTVDAVLDGAAAVPQEGEFWTEEQGEEGSTQEEKKGRAVFVLKHFWKWVLDYRRPDPIDSAAARGGGHTPDAIRNEIN